MNDLAQKILAADDRPNEKISLPEWGMDLWVRTMSGAERDAFEASINDGSGKSDLNNVRARLAVRVLVDEQGRRIFGDQDAGQLGQKNPVALDRIFTVAQRLNGMSNADIAELAKNSAAAPSDDSSSGSPSVSV